MANRVPEDRNRVFIGAYRKAGIFGVAAAIPNLSGILPNRMERRSWSEKDQVVETVSVLGISAI